MRIFATKNALRWAVLYSASLIAGCAGTGVNAGGVPGSSGQIAAALAAALEVIQVEDPQFIALPEAAVQRGDVVEISPQVIQIASVDELTVNPLPGVTVLGFKNRSGFDIFFRYVADGEPQAVFVFDQETLVLQYPCLHTIEFLTQDEFEPVTGVFVDSFPVSLVVLSNPTAFRCGEAIVLRIETAGVVSSTQVIALPS